MNGGQTKSWASSQLHTHIFSLGTLFLWDSLALTANTSLRLITFTHIAYYIPYPVVNMMSETVQPNTTAIYLSINTQIAPRGILRATVITLVAYLDARQLRYK